MNHKFILLALGLFWVNFTAQSQQRYSSDLTQQQSAVARAAQDVGEGRVLYGYSSLTAEITAKNGVGFKGTAEVKATAVIRFSEGINSLLKGRKIYSLKAGVAADINNITVFIQKTDGTILWEKTTDMKLGWNDVVLDTPFEMPEVNELYIGYTYMQTPDVYVAATAGSYKTNGLFMAEGEEELEESTGFGNLCLLVEADGTKSDFDCVGSLKAIYSPTPYLCKGSDQSVELSFVFFNEGESNVSKVTLGRMINGSEVSDTVCIFKRTVTPNNVGKFTLNVSPDVNTKYVFTLKKIGTATVNGLPKSVSVSVYDEKEAIQRMVLAEEFTSQSCGNCPEGQEALHNLIEGNEEHVALVLHHAGHEPDFFTVKESQTYCYFYALPYSYAPAMMMDRTYFSEYDSNGTKISPVFDPRRLTEESFSKEMQLPAVVSVKFKSSYDEVTRRLSVIVSGHKITELVGDHVGLNLYLLESNYISWQNSGMSGRREDFEHNNFLRAVLSSIKGDVITFNGDGTYCKEYTYTIPEKYITPDGISTKSHPENMHLVAFVSNFDTIYPDNCVVLNAGKTITLNHDDCSGVKSEDALERRISVYVNGGVVYLAGEYENFQLYNMQGMIVRNEGLTSGIYMVKIVDRDHKIHVEKILVQ